MYEMPDLREQQVLTLPDGVYIIRGTVDWDLFLDGPDGEVQVDEIPEGVPGDVRLYLSVQDDVVEDIIDEDWG
jgi:hypothetical protein